MQKSQVQAEESGKGEMMSDGRKTREQKRERGESEG